ncbi:uncharacterized protein BJ171DRAFT_519738 [Polychytrium aggregatum]|uniref:uncharacterized protein n=1 Tax=Polychytrium aggregatum TaxID=110093 RepID=UPI0022FF41CE|nr:uncharacterized protein BJ171DRAFT_519738 [Polychytrium aggregatum]KAI9197494.1 hypothetical protein BJ171DRAFT_519738 [Polychytrium aggregatum]
MYELSFTAYSKVLLHAAKYPTAAVGGLLLGTQASGTQTVVVSDAIPLFHQTALVPSIEAGLQQADIYAQLVGSKVVGFYSANESLANKSVSPLAAKIASKISDNFEGRGLLLLLDPSKASEEGAALSSILQPYVSQNGTWAPAGQRSSLKVDARGEKIRSLLVPKVYGALNDFDNHLDNIELDWIENAAVTKLIADSA